MTRFDGAWLPLLLRRYGYMRRFEGRRRWHFSGGDLDIQKAEKPPWVYLRERGLTGAWEPVSNLVVALRKLTLLQGDKDGKVRLGLRGPATNATASLYVETVPDPHWEETRTLHKEAVLHFGFGKGLKRTWTDDPDLVRLAEGAGMGWVDGSDFLDEMVRRLPRADDLREFQEMAEAVRARVLV